MKNSIKNLKNVLGILFDVLVAKVLQMIRVLLYMLYSCNSLDPSMEMRRNTYKSEDGPEAYESISNTSSRDDIYKLNKYAPKNPESKLKNTYKRSVSEVDCSNLRYTAQDNQDDDTISLPLLIEKIFSSSVWSKMISFCEEYQYLDLLNTLEDRVFELKDDEKKTKTKKSKESEESKITERIEHNYYSTDVFRSNIEYICELLSRDGEECRKQRNLNSALKSRGSFEESSRQSYGKWSGTYSNQFNTRLSNSNYNSIKCGMCQVIFEKPYSVAVGMTKSDGIELVCLKCFNEKNLTREFCVLRLFANFIDLNSLYNQGEFRLDNCRSIGAIDREMQMIFFVIKYFGNNYGKVRDEMESCLKLSESSIKDLLASLQKRLDTGFHRINQGIDPKSKDLSVLAKFSIGAVQTFPSLESVLGPAEGTKTEMKNILEKELTRIDNAKKGIYIPSNDFAALVRNEDSLAYSHEMYEKYRKLNAYAEQILDKNILNRIVKLGDTTLKYLIFNFLNKNFETLVNPEENRKTKTCSGTFPNLIKLIIAEATLNDRCKSINADLVMHIFNKMFDQNNKNEAIKILYFLEVLIDYINSCSQHNGFYDNGHNSKVSFGIEEKKWHNITESNNSMGMILSNLSAISFKNDEYLNNKFIYDQVVNKSNIMFYEQYDQEKFNPINHIDSIINILLNKNNISQLSSFPPSKVCEIINYLNQINCIYGYYTVQYIIENNLQEIVEKYFHESEDIEKLWITYTENADKANKKYEFSSVRRTRIFNDSKIKENRGPYESFEKEGSSHSSSNKKEMSNKNNRATGKLTKNHLDKKSNEVYLENYEEKEKQLDSSSMKAYSHTQSRVSQKGIYNSTLSKNY